MCDHHRPMTERMLPDVEVIDLAPGLWIWRLEHPAWNPDVDWQQVVTCVCADAGSERWLLPASAKMRAANGGCSIHFYRLMTRPKFGTASPTGRRRLWPCSLRIICGRPGAIGR